MPHFMGKGSLLLLILLGTSSEAAEKPTTTTEAPKSYDEGAATGLLAEMSKNLSEACNVRVKSEWTYECDMTEENKKTADLSVNAYTRAHKAYWAALDRFNSSGFEDANKRQMKLFSVLGVNALSMDRLYKYYKSKRAMEDTYATSKICTLADKEKFKDKCNKTLGLDRDLHGLMSRVRNGKELKHIWVEWRRETGKMRKDFAEFVGIFNEAAKKNKFSDAAEFVTAGYEVANFKAMVSRLWRQLEPFYQQLHAYTRFKLRKFYAAQNISIPQKGLLPAHLLGNMWGQSWTNLFDLLQPVPTKTPINISEKLKAIMPKPVDMAKKAEDFFVSLGLPALSPDFWTNSIWEYPTESKAVMSCHPAAFDFCDGKDFRIKMCGVVDMDNFLTVFHEMGHTHYQMQYAGLPKVFRDGANPAFHEAVGDMIGLSVTTPSYLKTLGVLESDASDPEMELNDLMMVALDKIAFLPFGYLVDAWRFNVYKSNSSKTYNCDWWKFREEVQGVTPPEQRNENQFDPGSKYHISSNTQYIGYFLSTIIQFQFHKALCTQAGQFDPASDKPLHRCNLFGNTAAGDKLKAMLEMGASQPWPMAMEKVTGEKTMNASAILDYFQPLILWLEKTNKANNETVGWEKPKTPSCKGEGIKGGQSSSTPSIALLVTLLLVLSTCKYI